MQEEQGLTAEELLADTETLTAILTYHVVPGKVMAADVMKLKGAKTVQGKKIKIRVKDGKVMVNKANVVKTDIVCKNGVIHVIDAVILPPSMTAAAEEDAMMEAMPDIVDIAVPTALHREIAVAAAEVGKHVFCEKPIALSAAEAQEMADVAEAAWRRGARFDHLDEAGNAAAEPSCPRAQTARLRSSG